MGGAIYRFVIRFLRVKDLSRVDLRQIVEDEEQSTELQDYLTTAKENCIDILKTLSFRPSRTRSYTMTDIKVPEGTEVISFSNNADEGLDCQAYEVGFNFENGKDDYEELYMIPGENNRFMIVPRRKNSKLVSLHYGIGYPCTLYHEYDIM